MKAQVCFFCFLWCTQVYNWVHSIDAFPLWEPSAWQLVTSYPRTVISRTKQAEEGNDSAVAEGEALLLKEAVQPGEDSMSLLVEKL